MYGPPRLRELSVTKRLSMEVGKYGALSRLLEWLPVSSLEAPRRKRSRLFPDCFPTVSRALPAFSRLFQRSIC